MGKGHKQRKLNNYLFVNKAQVTIGIGNLILLLLMAGLVTVAILSPFYSDIFEAEDIYLQHASSDIFLFLLERLALVFVILFVLIFLHQTLVIHKICGPLVSFTRTLEKLNSGDYTRKINLRRRDFFQNEASLVNGVLNDLSTMVSSLREHHQAIAADLDKASKKAGQSSELQNILHRIADQNRASLHELSKIKVIQPNDLDS